MRDDLAAQPAAEPLGRAVAAAAAQFRLVLRGGRYRGRIGQRRGTGPGSSLEFHDYRDYAPGDDLRHVDWRGYARTDQLRVRLHEAEVAPVVEVLLDTSPSMAISEAKQRTLRGLGLLFGVMAGHEGSSLRALSLGGPAVDIEHVALTGPLEPDVPQVPLRPGSVRVLLTDALWPTDPGPLLRRLASDAARFVCLQVLDPWERAPDLQGAVTLVDCEKGSRAALRLDARAISVYRERLERLCAEVRHTVLAQGGNHVLVEAGTLATICQRDLLPAGVVELA